MGVMPFETGDPVEDEYSSSSSTSVGSSSNQAVSSAGAENSTNVYTNAATNTYSNLSPSQDTNRYGETPVPITVPPAYSNLSPLPPVTNGCGGPEQGDRRDED